MKAVFYSVETWDESSPEQIRQFFTPSQTEAREVWGRDSVKVAPVHQSLSKITIEGGSNHDIAAAAAHATTLCNCDSSSKKPTHWDIEELEELP